MLLKIASHTRDEFIAHGHTIGNALKTASINSQKSVCLDGEADCGKSLLVLAINEVFNPHLYPKGIESHHCAEHITSIAILRPSVSFTNLWRQSMYQDAESLLKEQTTQHNTAKIVAVSNLFRKAIGQQHETSQMMPMPPSLDLHIMIQKSSYDESRTISLRTRNQALFTALADVINVSNNGYKETIAMEYK